MDEIEVAVAALKDRFPNQSEKDILAHGAKSAEGDVLKGLRRMLASDGVNFSDPIPDVREAAPEVPVEAPAAEVEASAPKPKRVRKRAAASVSPKGGK